MTGAVGRIGHLLIVSGPSASGKSAFLRELSLGRLPREIAEALPADAATWPRTNGDRLSGGLLRRLLARERSPEGLVLHYDFMRVFETLIADYSEDPALSVLGEAERVTVVVLRPDPERLVAQMERKSAAPMERRRFARRVRRVLRRLQNPARQFVYASGSAPARHSRLSALYKTQGFVDAWYERWAAFLSRRKPELVRLTVVVVAPAGGTGCAAEFRLVETRDG